MKPKLYKHSIYALSVCLSFLFLVSGCSHPHRTPAQAPHPNEALRDRSYEFRNAFASRSDGISYATQAIAQGAGPIPFQTSFQSLNEVVEAWKQKSPQSFFNNIISPKPEKAALLKASSGDFRDRPTIVIIPGVFGEFIKTRAFEEFFSRDSKFKSTVLPLIEGLTDQRYSTADLRENEVPLREVFHFSEGMDENQNPLFNLVLFDTALLSLESVGSIEAASDRFIRRFQKLDQAVGGFKNVILLGYSRGAAIGLEMVSREALPNVKALVSLGGVIYGADLSDEAINQDRNPAPSAASLQLESLEKLMNELQEVSSPLKAPQTVAKNTRAWTTFLRTMSSASRPNPGSETNASDIPSFKEKIESLKRIDPTSSLDIVTEFALHSFALNRPITQYSKNITRFKNLAREAITAVKGLSTEARVKWFQTHKLPPIQYYNVIATLAEQSALNPFLHNFKHPDFEMKLAGYAAAAQSTDQTVNDGQMTAPKAVLRNDITQSINPEQPAVPTHFLGLIQAHHWALALRNVNQVKAGSGVDPYDAFPREALIHSIAAIVAKDLAQ